jgi:hypothetical protein
MSSNSTSLQDAVHKGLLDGSHTAEVVWFDKHKAASLFGTNFPDRIKF